MNLPAPVKPLRCNNPDCGLPQGGRCARTSEFQNPVEDCTDLVRVDPNASEVPAELSSEAVEPLATIEENSDPTPWSGRHLGMQDALRLMGATPCRVVAVVGPYDSGKTCLLTSFFLQMANGGAKSLPYVFAGSRSLHGFLALAKQAGRYRGNPGEQVVDHTSKDEPEDVAAFLHLALRPRDAMDDRVIDLLLSDVPGEWFSDYAMEEDEKAARRLPFLERCDGFMVLADSHALLSEDGPQLDSRMGHLLRRLSKNMDEWGRSAPVLFVLSKYDLVWSTVGEPPSPAAALDATSWGSLGRRLRRTLGALQDMNEQGVNVHVVATSAVPRPLAQGQPIGVVEPFAWTLAQVDRRRHHERLHLPDLDGQPFMAMRREQRS